MSMASSVMDVAASALRTQALALSIRSEVEACVASLVSDVETAHALQDRLDRAEEVGQLRRSLDAARLQIEEASAVREEEARRRADVGDKFVVELLALSEQLSELERWKEENEGRVREYDEMRVRLERAERAIRAAKEGGRGDTVKEWDRPLGVVDASFVSSSVEAVEVAPEGTETGQDVAATAEIAGEEAVSPHEVPRRVAASAAAAVQDDTLTSDAAPLQDTEQVPAKADAGLTEQAPPLLENVDETTLMKIFAYLDAYDILSTAQVNVMLYSKIDALFGLGGSVGSGNNKGGVSSAVVEDEGGGDNMERSEIWDGSNAATPWTSAEKTGAERAKNVATSQTTRTSPKPSPPMSGAAPTIAAVPEQAGIPQMSPAPAPRGAGGLFSLLQTRVGQQQSQIKKSPAFSDTASTGSSTTASSIPAAGGGSSSTSEVRLNASMANSMAAKLTPAELSVIISMRDKLNQKEKEMEKLRIEKEDLAARLEGTESVKEFLINKVRDAERAHKASQEEGVKITQQDSSNQEVIAFLDGRVQELERMIKSLESGKKAAVDELARFRAQTDKKVRVLGDMLQFEREQMAESEKEWKATRKVLVKEVKNCRAQIVALQAERDSYYQQNATLKGALLSFNSGGSGSGFSSGSKDKR